MPWKITFTFVKQTLKLHRDSIVLSFVIGIYLRTQPLPVQYKREFCVKFDQNFLFEDIERFVLLDPIDFDSHKSCVKLRPTNFSKRKNFCHIRDVTEWGSQREIKFHDRSHIGNFHLRT